jgi:hypothetical protein
MIQDAAQSRAADKLAMIEDFLGLAGERIISLMQQYMTEDQVVRVVGLSGMNSRWINFDSDYIEGDFDFSVEAGSTQPNNETGKRQSAQQLMATMEPFVGAGVIDMNKLAIRVMTMFGVQNPEDLLVQQAAMPPGPVGPDGTPLGQPGNAVPPGPPAGGGGPMAQVPAPPPELPPFQ